MTLQEYIQRHIDWSQSTFGSGRRTVGLCKHIAKELDEIRGAPADVFEWIDVIILGIDGATRCAIDNNVPLCAVAEHVATRLAAKQDANHLREWPKTSNEDEPTEHVRGNE